MKSTTLLLLALMLCGCGEHKHVPAETMVANFSGTSNFVSVVKTGVTIQSGRVTDMVFAVVEWSTNGVDWVKHTLRETNGVVTVPPGMIQLGRDYTNQPIVISEAEWSVTNARIKGNRFETNQP